MPMSNVRIGLPCSAIGSEESGVFQALVVVNKQQQASNQLQALVSKKPGSVMPKPQWHAPWKLMRVSRVYARWK